ncbi:unnamed protein product [Caenorhabditis auriculariae]|uniref:Dolichyl-diphosphooligosaccharide--protein glycosyltransferase subunit STT3A n=1 Tax=Caenorhabditis auriculariae TaxID=2777116 RepID=A0A8S1HBC3_9PELO|nr:unnamed protein product [Caenorhabditis auriculariae]
MEQLLKHLPHWSTEKKEVALRLIILLVASLTAFTVRLFAVVRYESVIHEYDPYFNYRTTQYLTANGYYNFHNWFDDRSWYPLGRIIGGTIYPGLMVTSAFIFNVMNSMNLSIHIREVCVFLAPLFSAFYCPGDFSSHKRTQEYRRRSVAGSYDNEAIAIFAMLFTFYLWIKAVKTGSISYSVLCSFAYFYMVSSWGGYVFLINIMPLHILALLITGRFNRKHYIAWSTVYSIGTILSMQIPFVGFQPILTSEHMGALGVFGICQLVVFSQYLQSKMSKASYDLLFRSVLYGLGFAMLATIVLLSIFGKIAPWTGRFYSLLDPSYAKNYIPIIASVSEHQPTAWSSFYFDLHILVFTFPVGLYYCFRNLSDHNIFIILYAVTSMYFSGVMVRLMLVLAPVMCIMGGIALNGVLSGFAKNFEDQPIAKSKKDIQKAQNYPYKKEVATGVYAMILFLGVSYIFHSVWVTKESYSSPSIVLSARGARGQEIIFDDFREAYYWLRQNTPEDAKIMSWWDYGYQITAIANRTVIVDNNTWNNTHISRVGQAMASSEKDAYEIMRELDVDYVLVIFGGVIGYSSDDINKFLWMIRIGGSTPEGKHIKETDFYTRDGEYRIDKSASSTMLNSLLYKLSYYRFGYTFIAQGYPTGFDRVRNAEIGNKDFELEYLEEAYTTERWLVRIYRVKKPKNRNVLNLAACETEVTMNCCPNQLNSLVWRHLRDSGYHRSAYLFYTECGLAEAGLADKIESLPRGSLLNVVQKGVLYTEAVQPKEIRDVRTDQVTVFEAAGLVVEPERRETSRQDNLEDIIDVVGTSGPSSDVPRETNAAVESNETDNEKAPLSGSPLFVSQHNETVSSETVPSGPTLGNQEMVSHSSDFSTSLTALKPELPAPTFQPCELGGPKELTPNTLVKEEGTNNFLNSTLANLTKNIVPASYGEHLPQSFRAILRDAPSSSSSISLSPELLAILTSTDPSFLNAQFTLLPPVLASSTTFSVPSLTFCPPVVSSVAPTLPPQRILRFNPPPIMPALPTMVSPKVPVKTETSSNEKSVTEAPPIEKMMTRSRTRPLVSDPPTLPPVVAPKKERRHKLASLREHFCSLARAKQITRHPQVTTGLHFEPCSYQLFHRHRGEIFNSAWNPLIDYLVTGSADSDARIWDLTEVNSRKYEGSNVDTITRRLPHHTEAPDTPEAISRKVRNHDLMKKCFEIL